MQQKVQSCGLNPVDVPNESTVSLHPYNHSKANIVCSQKSAVKSSLVNCPSGTFNFNVLLGHLDIFPFWSLFGGELTNVAEMMMRGALVSSRRVEITLFTRPTCLLLVEKIKQWFADDDNNFVAQRGRWCFIFASGASIGMAAEFLKF